MKVRTLSEGLRQYKLHFLNDRFPQPESEGNSPPGIPPVRLCNIVQMTPLRTHMSGAPSGLSLHHFSKSETQYYNPNPALIPPPSSVSGRAGLVVVVKTCRLEIIFVRNERHVASAAHSPEPAVVVVVSKDPFPLWIFCSEDL